MKVIFKYSHILTSFELNNLMIKDINSLKIPKGVKIDLYFGSDVEDILNDLFSLIVRWESNKYYRMNGDYKGHHYFKVSEYSLTKDVVKISFGVPLKRGRAYCPGISLIKRTSFISNYAHKIYGLKEITKCEYEKAYSLILKKLK